MVRLAWTLGLLAGLALAESPFPQAKGGTFHLKAAESPYFLGENAVISAQDTLRIDAGVDVRMGPYAKLLVNGVAEIEGSEAGPVRFMPADSGESWNGVHFIATSKPFSVSHLLIEGAFRNTVSSSSGLFENSKFVDNYHGLKLYSSEEVMLKGCEFTRNRFAISATASTILAERVSVAGNVFGVVLEGDSKFLGSRAGISENLEADFRDASLEEGDGRIPFSVWQRLETAF